MKEAVKTLQKWTDSWVIGKTEYVWDGGSDEDLDVVHASLRTVLTALTSATARAEAVREFVDRLAADLDKCKGWHGIKEDDLHVGLMDFAKHRAREVAAEMGISLEGK